MTEHVSDANLLARLKDCPQRGTRWRHVTTGQQVYIIVCALNEATCEPLVIYNHADEAGRPCLAPLSEQLVWSRARSVFLERFTPETEPCPFAPSD